MKKRLLITSIVMMLVVAVALSTATYAWFTSNSSVTASTIKLTAATSNESALGIGWIGTSAYGTASNSITADAAGTYQPMVPAALAAGTTPSTVGFEGATIKSVNGNYVFNDDVASLTPYKFVNGASNQAFYVKNLSTANDVGNLRLTVTWAEHNYSLAGEFKAGTTYYTLNNNTYTAADPQPTSSTFGDGIYYAEDLTNDNLVRIAVFCKATAKKTTPDSGAYLLKGVLGKTANLDTEFGDVAANGSVADLCTEPVKTVDHIDFGALAAENQVDMVVLVWLDGVVLDDDQAGKVSSFGLSFAALAA